MSQLIKNNKFLIKEIYDAIQVCRQDESRNVYVKKYKVYKQLYKYENQFIILIKPEICNFDKIAMEKILHYMFEKFEKNSIWINSCTVVNGSCIRENAFVENQYSVLNKGARYGYEGIPLNYQKIVSEKFPNHEVIGAYQFLNMNHEYTAKKLEEKAHKLGSYKVGNGTYILDLCVDGLEYAIVNAFHPYQVNHFQENGKVTVALDCLSNANYSILCDSVIGDFRPAYAKKNSFRDYIYKNRNELNFLDVSTLYNGFHISPSPLEAMWAIDRYCFPNQAPINYSKLNLGKRLLDNGLTPEGIDNIKNNPIYLFEGELKSVFDVVERQNSSKIIEIMNEML